jgi:OmcA/MtrC family decaheme c-type cytochrome
MVACEGPAGPAGNNGGTALVSTSPEAPGANCPNGGTKVEVGIDSNGNGQLDDSEITGTSYVCNGPGTTSLVATSPEPAGANCPFGGTKIEQGVDTNNNGVLDPSEVDAAATSYVCVIGPPGALSPSTGIVAQVVPGGVSTSVTDPITVHFTLKDDRGYPLDIAGVYSQNTALQPRFAIAHFTTDSAGNVQPLSTYTLSTSTAVPAGQPTMYNPASAGQGTLVENGYGAGDYTYTFPTTSQPTGPVAVAYDQTKLDDTHVVWIQVARQTDLTYTDDAKTFSASNAPYYFVPSGHGTPLTREIVSSDKCANCHNDFKPETTVSSQFHGGARVNPTMCNVCHNPGHTSNPDASSASFIHRIHNSDEVATANLFHGISISYPQDTRNCSACHAGAAQGGQSVSNPSQLACKGCHDYVAFDGSAPATCGVTAGSGTGPVLGADGKPVPCNHFAGPQTDCASCHGPSGGFPSSRYHVAVAPPDPNNMLNGGTNANTNASYVAAGGVVPAGADVITYSVKSVDTVADTTPTIQRPRIVFKLQRNGADVVLPDPTAATELMAGFVGSPSAYFAFAVPQDGNLAPTDFNASVSGYVKTIWKTGTGGSLSGPDTSGYYTLVLTTVQVPASATMLTGGIGYTYSLTSTPPLVQTNVAGYPYNATTKQGGLSVPPPNVWKVATGYIGRRSIVDTGKCNACHGALGVTPTFHAGQRNDGPTCSFCHNPNKTSSGWAAGSKYFIHAIHGARVRTTPFNWHATATDSFADIGFPSPLNECTSCHLPNTYDFTSAPNLATLGSQELSTAATGVFDSTSATYTLNTSPYIQALVPGGGSADFGAGFSYNATTNTTTEAAGTTLVLSPVTGACSACHDSPADLDHMKSNGGLFYAPRSVALSPTTAQEQCLLCHGPGRTAAIGIVHQQ